VNSVAEQFSGTIQEKFEIHEWRHATAILKSDFPTEFSDICDVLESKGPGSISEHKSAKSQYPRAFPAISAMKPPLIRDFHN
jgi:hypothetical protein